MSGGPLLAGDRDGPLPGGWSIPVADAPLEPTGRPRRQRGLGGGFGARQAFMLLILLLVGWTYMQVLATGGTILFTLGVALRYALLPMIALAVALHVQRGGPFDLLRGIAIVLPFFVIGVASGVSNDDPIGAARSLAFWILGVLGAAVIAEEIPPERLIRILFWSFFAVLALSVVAAVAAPSIGRGSPSGHIEKAWRGVTTGKNSLANASIYAGIMCGFVRGVRPAWRVASACLVLACLAFARSGGGIVQAAAIMVFVALVLVLRRLPLSRPLRSGLLVGILASGAFAAFTMLAFLLELIGKDPTLTGRTSIWPAYFQRALDYWVIGAGPGTFTQLSLVTVDLGSSMQDLGEINTPHNMYIAAFGEVGLFGLIAFVAIFLYTAVIVPFARRSPIAIVAAAVAMASIVGGLSETREVFGTGMGMFLLVLCSVAARRADAPCRPANEAPERDEQGSRRATLLALGD